MRATSFVLLILSLPALLSIGAGTASAQFRVAPVPTGGFGGAGALGPAGGVGGLGNSGLGNDFGSSRLGDLPLVPEHYVLPDYNIAPGVAGASSGSSPPPPDEPRWNGPYVASPPSDQGRDDTTPPPPNEVRAPSPPPADATAKEPSGWRWKWWHGVVVLVIVGLVVAGRTK